MTILDNINQSFEKLFEKNLADKAFPRVCVVCDQLLPTKSLLLITAPKLLQYHRLLTQNLHGKISNSICQSYSVNCHDCTQVQQKAIKKLLLSPRSLYKKRNNCKESTFIIRLASCIFAIK